MSPLQRVYELAASGELDCARSAMDLVTVEDGVCVFPAASCGRHCTHTTRTHCAVGLENERYARGDAISYHHVFTDSKLSISIFVLPEGSSIPLHDHPDMTVLSKLLYGALHVTSYDKPDASTGARLHQGTTTCLHTLRVKASPLIALSRSTSHFTRCSSGPTLGTVRVVAS